MYDFVFKAVMFFRLTSACLKDVGGDFHSYHFCITPKGLLCQNMFIKFTFEGVTDWTPQAAHQVSGEVIE